MTTVDEWRRAFADAFAGDGTPLEQRVYASVLGEDHPTELDTYSCTTWAELGRIERWLAPAPDDVLVDVGCGRGGPGVWLAARAGARLVGVDVTDVPLAAAAKRAARAGVPASFGVGSIDATGLASDSAEAVLSIDVLQFAPDATIALRELARVLRPGGRLALTAAEHVDDLEQSVDRPSVIAAAALAAGLEVAACWTPPDWPATARRISAAMWAAADVIAAEADADPVEVRAALERLAGHRRQERRVVLLARRPA